MGGLVQDKAIADAPRSQSTRPTQTEDPVSDCPPTDRSSFVDRSSSVDILILPSEIKPRSKVSEDGWRSFCIHVRARLIRFRYR
jgi:hypothetical protein